jgi:hypothetical protein
VNSGKPAQLHPIKDVINGKLKDISDGAVAEAWPHYNVNKSLHIIQAVVAKCKVWVLHILWHKAKECSYSCSVAHIKAQQTERAYRWV